MRDLICAPTLPAALALGCALLLGHGPALQAAGLGQARVLSAAGETLRVRIELIMGPGDRPERIRAAVASPSLSQGDAGNQLSVSVVPTHNGRAVLAVRSSAPVHQPGLDLIVAVSSPAGRAHRNFVLALPEAPRPGSGFAAAQPGPAAAAPQRSPVPVPQRADKSPARPPTQLPQTPAPAPEPAPAPAPAPVDAAAAVPTHPVAPHPDPAAQAAAASRAPVTVHQSAEEMVISAIGEHAQADGNGIAVDAMPEADSAQRSAPEPAPAPNAARSGPGDCCANGTADSARNPTGSVANPAGTAAAPVEGAPVARSAVLRADRSRQNPVAPRRGEPVSMQAAETPRHGTRGARGDPAVPAAPAAPATPVQPPALGSAPGTAAQAASFGLNEAFLALAAAAVAGIAALLARRRWYG